jgi:hypothetical protein
MVTGAELYQETDLHAPIALGCVVASTAALPALEYDDAARCCATR